MEPFSTISAVAAPIESTNIDTDQILPARFLKSPREGGYGRFLFHDLRFREDGIEHPDFVLNRSSYRNAKILIANENFGCGSSREGAVYALLDHGFRCIIAPSFNDIFYTNSLRNGLLPAKVSPDDAAMLRRLVAADPGTKLTVDLPSQSIVFTGSNGIDFAVDPFGKSCLLRGLDDIAFTGEYADVIERFSAKYSADQPWLARDSVRTSR